MAAAGCGGDDDASESDAAGATKPAAPTLSIKQVQACIEPHTANLDHNPDSEFQADELSGASESLFVATFKPDVPVSQVDEEDPTGGEVRVMVLDLKTAAAAKDGLASVKAGLGEADARDQEQGATVASNAHASRKANLVAEFDSAHPDVDRIVSSCLAGKPIKAENLTDPKALRSCLQAAGAKKVRRIPEAEYEYADQEYGTYAITDSLSTNDASGTAVELATEVDYAVINGVGVIVLPQKTAQRAKSFADAATQEITAAAEADDSEIADNFASSEGNLLFEFEKTSPGAAPALAAKVAGCAG